MSKKPSDTWVSFVNESSDEQIAHRFTNGNKATKDGIITACKSIGRIVNFTGQKPVEQQPIVNESTIVDSVQVVEQPEPVEEQLEPVEEQQEEMLYGIPAKEYFALSALERVRLQVHGNTAG